MATRYWIAKDKFNTSLFIRKPKLRHGVYQCGRGGTLICCDDWTGEGVVAVAALLRHIGEGMKLGGLMPC